MLALVEPTEKAIATHSSTLAWKIPWMEEPGGLQSMGLRRVGHDWSTSFYFSLSCIGEGNGNPLQCSCLENPMNGGAWWAAVYGVTQSLTQLKWLSSSSSSGTKTGKKGNIGHLLCCRQHLRFSSHILSQSFSRMDIFISTFNNIITRIRRIMLSAASNYSNWYLQVWNLNRPVLAASDGIYDWQWLNQIVFYIF